MKNTICNFYRGLVSKAISCSNLVSTPKVFRPLPPPPPLDEVQSVMQSMSRPLKAMLMTLLDLMSIAILPVDSNTVVKNVKL